MGESFNRWRSKSSPRIRTARRATRLRWSTFENKLCNKFRFDKHIDLVRRECGPYLRRVCALAVVSVDGINRARVQSQSSFVEHRSQWRESHWRYIVPAIWTNPI